MESQWKNGNSNLDRIDRALNEAEGALREIYYRDRSRHGKFKSKGQILYKVNGHCAHLEKGSYFDDDKIRIRVSKACTIELIDTNDMCLKIPLQESIYEKLENIDHIVYLSNKKNRYNGLTEIVIIDCYKIMEILSVVQSATAETLIENGYRVLKGYLTLTLDWYRQSGMLLGHYLVNNEAWAYRDLETEEEYPQLEKKFLAWHKFKLCPFDTTKKRVQLINVDDQTIEYYTSAKEVCEALNISKQKLSYHLTGKSKYFMANGKMFIGIYLDEEANPLEAFREKARALKKAGLYKGKVYGYEETTNI
jgi:hypothetical protein